MSNDYRVQEVSEQLHEYVKSPSLRHIRDPYAINKLAHQIMRRLDGSNSTWKKWNGPRESLLKLAAHCWIPVDDMCDFLNSMDGQHLTITDVAQRLRAFHDEPFMSYPNEELQRGCLAIFQREKAQGTELPAIVGALQEYVEIEEERLRNEREMALRDSAQREREALELRFSSGADCKWTQLGRSKEFYCRVNGRAFRLTPTKDKMWDLHRIESEHDNAGILIGRYLTRGDTRKVLAQVAYQPELRR